MSHDAMLQTHRSHCLLMGHHRYKIEGLLPRLEVPLSPNHWFSLGEIQQFHSEPNHGGIHFSHSWKGQKDGSIFLMPTYVRNGFCANIENQF